MISDRISSLSNRSSPLSRQQCSTDQNRRCIHQRRSQPQGMTLLLMFLWTYSAHLTRRRPSQESLHRRRVRALRLRSDNSLTRPISMVSRDSKLIHRSAPQDQRESERRRLESYYGSSPLRFWLNPECLCQLHLVQSTTSKVETRIASEVTPQSCLT